MRPRPLTPMTREDMLALWRRVTPTSYSYPLEQAGGGHGIELVTAMAAMNARASQAVVQADTDYRIDTAPGGTGRFTTATPAVTSGKYLRVNVTMTPTSDKLLSPTLLGWKVVYDCPAVE